jgi:hypothetical protein
MSYTNFEEYLASLAKKVKNLKSKIDEAGKSIVEQGLSFEIKKNDLYEVVAGEQRGYKPSGTGLNININSDSKISNEEITKILSSMYKLS